MYLFISNRLMWHNILYLQNSLHPCEWIIVIRYNKYWNQYLYKIVTKEWTQYNVPSTKVELNINSIRILQCVIGETFNVLTFNFNYSKSNCNVKDMIR